LHFNTFLSTPALSVFDRWQQGLEGPILTRTETISRVRRPHLTGDPAGEGSTRRGSRRQGTAEPPEFGQGRLCSLWSTEL